MRAIGAEWGSARLWFSAPVKPMAKAAAAAAMVRVRKEAAITVLKCAPSAMFRFVIAGAPVLWLIRLSRGYRKAQALTRGARQSSALRAFERDANLSLGGEGSCGAFCAD